MRIKRGQKINYSLRVKLLTLYAVTAFIPAILMIGIMPSFYQSIVSKETQQLTMSTLSAISGTIESYLQDLDRLTLFPYYSEDALYGLALHSSGEYSTSDAYNKLVADRAIKNLLRDVFRNTREDISSTIVLPFDGSVFVANNEGYADINIAYPFTTQKWYQKAMTANGKAAFISPHAQDYMMSTHNKTVFSVSRLIKNPYTQVPIALIMADADTRVFKDIIQKVNFNVSSIVMIFDDSNQLIYSNSNATEEVLSQVLAGNENIESPTGNYQLVRTTIENTNWHIALLLSSAELNSQIRWMYIIGGFFALLGLSITFILFSTLSKSILDPFKEMTSVMQDVEQGNLKSRFTGSGSDEIASLGQALNAMILQVEHHIETEYKAVLSERNAQLFALHSQIQPHFLYNTLNGFIGLNRLGEKEKLERGILALTGMLRYVLNQESHQSLENEFLYIKRYIELQQLRFGDRLCYTIDFDPKIGSLQIPKLLLQPLVENAILHGLEPMEGTTEILVKAKLNDNTLSLTVSDNGAGFDMNKPNDHDVPSIGLTNIQNRLALLGKDATFSIQSQINKGTSVFIKIQTGGLT
jgi:two-component system sensor histidine kinase YesM